MILISKSILETGIGFVNMQVRESDISMWFDNVVITPEIFLLSTIFALIVGYILGYIKGTE